MLGQYIIDRPVYQFGKLIDSYAFNLGALHSDRSKFGSIAHNSKVGQSSNGPATQQCAGLPYVSSQIINWAPHARNFRRRKY